MSHGLNKQVRDDLRKLWNEYDPIGIFPIDETLVVNPVDEYDSYHGVVLNLLMQGADKEKFLLELKKLTTEYFDADWNAKFKAQTEKFIANLIDWYDDEKLGTRQ
jgi:6-phosphogluconolactonase/glucosamine-6-phosphate isomerase/deaminase